jgi:3-oxoacyl-[acyl-carrier protein] reductase
MATYPELKNRVVLITGGAQGIGLSTAEEFAKQGALVAVLDIDLVGAQKVADSINQTGQRAIAIKTDVTSEASVISSLKSVNDIFNGIDIVINSAGGYGKLTSVEEMPVDEWDRTVALNMRGTFLVCKHLVCKVYSL